MMNKANSSQIRALWTTLASLGMKDEKESLILEATGGRTSSSRAMSYEEMKDMLTHLNQKGPKYTRKVDEKKVQMTRKMHFFCHQMEWQLTHDDGILKLVDGRPKIDQERLDNWCMKYGQFHKPFKKHSTDQLHHLLTQFEKVYEQHIQP